MRYCKSGGQTRPSVCLLFLIEPKGKGTQLLEFCDAGRRASLVHGKRAGVLKNDPGAGNSLFRFDLHHNVAVIVNTRRHCERYPRLLESYRFGEYPLADIRSNVSDGTEVVEKGTLLEDIVGIEEREDGPDGSSIDHIASEEEDGEG